MQNLPAVLATKINQDLQTKGNNADPKMQVILARAKSSVQDSAYFAVETIRYTDGVSDISVTAKRQKAYGPPTELYAAHINNGTARILKRDYPDTLKLEWVEMFTLGPATAISIIMDGYWQRYRKLWQLVSFDRPDIFWVDPSKKLWAQHWDNSLEKEELANNVVKVKAIRGWKNTVVRLQDVGIVVAYIKTDGRVYYRNFTEQEFGPRDWELETLVEEFTGTAININLFLTNDYRTAIIVENNLGQIQWFITSRNWGGMAIAPEQFNVHTEAKVKLIPVPYTRAKDNHIFTTQTTAVVELLRDNQTNQINTVYNIDDDSGDFGNTIKFTTMYKIANLNPLDFNIVDNLGITFTCISVVKSGTLEYKATFTNFNNAHGSGTLKVLSLYTTNAAGLLTDPFEKIFAFVNLDPVDIPAPLVISIANVADTGVLIELDRPLVYGVEQSLSSFKLVGYYWKDTFKDILMTMNYVISTIKQIDDTHILLTVQYPQNRIKQSHQINVQYDTALGGIIVGETYPLASFDIPFTPNIAPLLNPATREKFTVKTNSAVTLTKIIYGAAYAADSKFTITTNATVSLTFVGVINP